MVFVSMLWKQMRLRDCVNLCPLLENWQRELRHNTEHVSLVTGAASVLVKIFSGRDCEHCGPSFLETLDLACKVLLAVRGATSEPWASLVSAEVAAALVGAVPEAAKSLAGLVSAAVGSSILFVTVLTSSAFMLKACRLTCSARLLEVHLIYLLTSKSYSSMKRTMGLHEVFYTWKT